MTTPHAPDLVELARSDPLLTGQAGDEFVELLTLTISRNERAIPDDEEVPGESLPCPACSRRFPHIAAMVEHQAQMVDYVCPDPLEPLTP